MGTTKDSEKTRAKIIKAAGQLFGERGYKGVTVRDIVQKAKTHLSALNYHFKSKEALYREVLLEACREAAISPSDQKQLLKLDPGDALHLIIKEGLKEYSKQSASNWQTVILNRETWEPSPAFDEVIRDYFKPDTDFLSRIVAKKVGKEPDSVDVRFAVISLMALLETFGLYGHLIDGVAPGLNKHLKKKDLLVKKITRMVIEAANASHKE